jgi:hypothetical protein
VAQDCEISGTKQGRRKGDLTWTIHWGRYIPHHDVVQLWHKRRRVGVGRIFENFDVMLDTLAAPCGASEDVSVFDTNLLSSEKLFEMMLLRSCVDGLGILV